MRIEPPPSVACAIGTTPAATNAADPPDEPPALRDGSQGLRVAPCRRDSLLGEPPNSGLWVLPKTTRPGGVKALDDGAVVVVALVAEEARALGGDGALHGDGEVLEQEGHAAERAIGKRRADAPPGEVEVPDGETGERRVDGLGAGDRDLEELARADFAARDEAREGEAIEARVLVEGQGAVAARGGSRADGFRATRE